MVLEDNGSLPPSRTPYDKKVARTISGGRGYKPRIVLSRQEKERKQYIKQNQNDSDISEKSIL